MMTDPMACSTWASAAMPGARRWAAFDSIHAQAPELPIIFYAHRGDVTEGSEAVHRGAQDYLVKGSTDGPQPFRTGLVVREAANGEEALAAIRQKRPSLVLLDLMMPVMDGFEFLRQLRNDPDVCDIKVVVLTAKDLTLDDRARLDSLVTQVLQKGGLRREDLLGSVRRSVARAAAEAGSTSD